MRALAALLPIAWLLSGTAANSEDRIAELGKQRAIDSRLEWEIREASHPVLGPIRFAHLATPIVTTVGSAKVYSSAYVSCETDARTIAIELTNQRSLDDPGGLRPTAPPRLVCKSPGATPGGTVQETLDADWRINDIGDAMARGLRPWSLRSCSSIGIVQHIALPKGWTRATLPLEFEITPYARELDAIFTTCGEPSAYTAASTAQRGSASRSTQAPRETTSDGWKTARTIRSGKTDVHASPDLRSRTVAQLAPGALILVQRVEGPWWRAKSRFGFKWEGYVREDRLIAK
jgi:hypothetical protein